MGGKKKNCLDSKSLNRPINTDKGSQRTVRTATISKETLIAAVSGTLRQIQTGTVE